MILTLVLGFHSILKHLLLILAIYDHWNAPKCTKLGSKTPKIASGWGSAPDHAGWLLSPDPLKWPPLLKFLGTPLDTLVNRTDVTGVSIVSPPHKQRITEPELGKNGALLYLCKRINFVITFIDQRGRIKWTVMTGSPVICRESGNWLTCLHHSLY